MKAAAGRQRQLTTHFFPNKMLEHTENAKGPQEAVASKESTRSRSRSRSQERLRRPGRFGQRSDDRRVFRPGLAGALLTFKEFMELQHHPLELAEAEKFYNEYKAQYERKQFEIFFKEHADDHWFIEKYDPLVSQKWQEERFLNAKLSHTAFVDAARSGEFADLLLRDTGQRADKLAGPPFYGFDPNSMTLFLKAIPVNISRWDVLGVVKTSPGFVSLSMSEPLKTQNFSRFAWALYDSEAHCQESLELLTNKTVNGDFKLLPVRSQSSSRKEVQVTPLQPLDSIQVDWRQATRLIQLLDSEKGIEDNALLVAEDKFQSLSPAEQELQLDLQLLYLRRVHAFCYYCVDEYEDERMLSAKCGPAHVRARFDASAVRSPEFDKRISARLNNPLAAAKYSSETDAGLHEALEAFEAENSSEEGQAVRCKVCKKLFRGAEFIRKHLRIKHADKVEEVVNKRIKKLTLDNYLKDPEKIVNPINSEASRTAKPRRFGRRPPTSGAYEDLDDAGAKSKRKVIDYSDL